jgi:hypothetical protein
MTLADATTSALNLGKSYGYTVGFSRLTSANQQQPPLCTLARAMAVQRVLHA